MKTVLGGDDYGSCYTGTQCTLHIRELNANYSGHCDYDISSSECFCHVTVNGQNYYTDPSTVSVCVP